MTQLSSEVDRQVKHFLATGQYQSEDEVLRDALKALAERHSVLDDIRQGLTELESGQGRPLEDVDADLRKKYDIPQDA